MSRRRKEGPRSLAKRMKERVKEAREHLADDSAFGAARRTIEQWAGDRYNNGVPLSMMDWRAAGHPELHQEHYRLMQEIILDRARRKRRSLVLLKR